MPCKVHTPWEHEKISHRLFACHGCRPTKSGLVQSLEGVRPPAVFGSCEITPREQTQGGFVGLARKTSFLLGSVHHYPSAVSAVSTADYRVVY